MAGIRATTVRAFDCVVLPGLLQTRDYVQAVLTAAAWAAGPEQVARWVQLRMDRQAVLHRDVPPQLSVIIDEFLLRRQIGGRDVQCGDVQRGQVAHLLGCMELPQLDLRVLPVSLGAHASLRGGFWVFTIAEPDLEVGYAETAGGAVYVEPPDSEWLVRVYDQLLDSALEPGSPPSLSAPSERICHGPRPRGPGPRPERSGRHRLADR